MAWHRNISDKALVLGRIDYGEKDRIITLLTANHGKLKAIAKSVRSGKSKLAGGIELFAENQLVLLKGKSDLYTLTSSRMDRFFGNISSDIDRSLYAYDCLKNVNKLTPDHEGSDYYQALLGVLMALNDKTMPLQQIKIWFSLKLLDFVGVSPNLKTMPDKEPLPAEKKYNFDFDHQCFTVHESGKYTQDHVKIFRYFNGQDFFASINNCPARTAAESERLAAMLLGEYTG